MVRYVRRFEKDISRRDVVITIVLMIKRNPGFGFVFEIKRSGIWIRFRGGSRE